MTSVLLVDTIKNSLDSADTVAITGGIHAPGTPIQMFQHSTNATLSGTLGFANNPDSTTGTSFTTFNFTPKRSDSDLYFWSSMITCYETANEGDEVFVSSWYDTTKVTLNYAPIRYSSFANNYDARSIAMFGKISSWGTSQKTITVRVGMSGTACYVNYHSAYPASHGGQNGNNNVYFNVMEVAT